MALLFTPVEKAQRRLSDIRADLASARARLSPDLDFDAVFNLREDIATLERKEAAAVDALAYAEEQAAKAEAEAAKADAAAQVDAYRREAAREVPGRLNKIGKLQAALAEELALVAAHVERADEVNRLAREFGLTGVQDGEMLFRGTKARTEPAQHEEREVWQDAEGNQPYQYRQGPDGELVPIERGFVKKWVRVCVRPEQHTPGNLPGGRLAPAIRLMGLDGQTLWPVR